MNTPELVLGTMHIGNLYDTTHHLIDSIRQADIIAVENEKPIMEVIDFYNIPTKAEIIVMFPSKSSIFIGNDIADMDAASKGLLAQNQKVINFLSMGKKVLCISDEGSPLITDPFAALNNLANNAGYSVKVLPGPSAIISALSYSKGYLGGSFSFHGMLFYDPDKLKKYKIIEESEYPSVIFYHYEIQEQFLKELSDAIGMDREATLLSRLTTKDQRIFEGSIGDIIDFVSKNQVKIPTIVVAGKRVMGNA